MKIIPTVTVAICACNEEANIGRLIKSILEQKESSFRFEKLFVVSDGSTDKTVEIIKSFNSPKLEIIDYKTRMGKSYRLNEIYSVVHSDFIVQPDADVILGHSGVLREIISPMIKNEKVGITGGNSNPMKPVTLVEKAVKTTFDAYSCIIKVLLRGNNIYTATGRLIALRKAAYKNLKVPRHTISNDHFVYFKIISRNFFYRFSPNAKVYFRLPQTLRDHISQETRFASAERFMKIYFSPELVNKEYFIPRSLLFREVIQQVIKHPLLSLLAFMMNKYCQLQVTFNRTKVSSLWEIVYSTKKLVN